MATVLKFATLFPKDQPLDGDSIDWITDVYNYYSKRDYVLYEIKITRAAYDSFSNAVRDACPNPIASVTPAWCEKSPRESEEHAHLFVVYNSKLGNFEEEIWSKISIPNELEDRPELAFKEKERVVSPRHFVAALENKRFPGCGGRNRKKSNICTARTAGSTPTA